MKFKIVEDLWKDDDTYQPEKDSKYRALIKKPINTLTNEELEYIYVIFNCWYLSKVMSFDSYK